MGGLGVLGGVDGPYNRATATPPRATYYIHTHTHIYIYTCKPTLGSSTKYCAREILRPTVTVKHCPRLQECGVL